MLKYSFLLRICFFCALLPCGVLLSFLPVQAAQATQQGMDVYGGAYTPAQAPSTNSQGFQTFQVAPPTGGAPAASGPPPSFVQPPVQNAPQNPHTSGQVVLQPSGQPLGQPPIQTLRQNSVSGPVSPPVSVPRSQGQNPTQMPHQGNQNQGNQMPGQFGVPQNVPLMAPAPSAVSPPPSLPASPPKPTQEEMDKTYLEAANDFSQAKYAQAINTWQKLAGEGHAPSMVALGLLQDRGHSGAKIPVNTKDALTWFRKAAELNHRDGMYHLGRMLVHGRGNATGQKHTDTAAVWFRKAADLGQHDAQYALGVLYERGEGVVRSLKDAVAWYSHAAAGQNVAAQARLGHLYRVGQGVPKNISRATLLLYGATMAGNVTAQDELFDMAKEQFPQEFPKVTLFGADLSGSKGVTRATMRSALSVSKVPALREDINYICDVYDLGKVVPGSKEMAICYGSNDAKTHKGDQEIGFIKIDYPAKTAKDAKVIQDMVTQRFGPPIAGEQGQGHLWNLGPVIVATQFEAKNEEVGLMYMIPRVYHTTQSKP